MTLFIAKNDWDNDVTFLFTGSGKTVWFIEHKKTAEWIAVYSFPTNPELTTDPNATMQFASQMSAYSYILRNNLGSDYHETEHEFTTNQPTK